MVIFIPFSHLLDCSYPMYVGSAGATYLPVMFADRVVLPPELALDVSEKVVFMPETFYFNSHPTSFPSSGTALCPPSERNKWNLPSSGVVLLNHNQFYKFDKFSFYTMSAPLPSFVFIQLHVTMANSSGAPRLQHRSMQARGAARFG
jgi:hypothetical protein